MDMDYFNFENTYKALTRCLESGPASEKERKYARKIFETIIDTLINEEVIEGYDKEELDYFIKVL